MKKMSTRVSLIVAGLITATACGGEPLEDRVCQAMVDCGALSPAYYQECTTAFERVPQRALEECADCVETERCADIAQGACAAECGSLPVSLDPNYGIDEDTPITSLTASEEEIL